MSGIDKTILKSISIALWDVVSFKRQPCVFAYSLFFYLPFFSDAVDALVECGMARNRKDAVELGQNLAKEQQLFQHVTGDQDFCDDYVFFRFSDLPNDPQGEAAILEEHEEEKNNEIPFFLE